MAVGEGVVGFQSIVEAIDMRRVTISRLRATMEPGDMAKKMCSTLSIRLLLVRSPWQHLTPQYRSDPG
jgi:hypothetical protein